MLSEEKSPLLIDANAVLGLSIVPQRLETIAGRDTHEFQISGSIKLSKLASSDLFNVDKSFDAEAGVQRGCVFTLARHNSHVHIDN